MSTLLSSVDIATFIGSLANEIIKNNKNMAAKLFQTWKSTNYSMTSCHIENDLILLDVQKHVSAKFWSNPF